MPNATAVPNGTFPAIRRRQPLSAPSDATESMVDPDRIADDIPLALTGETLAQALARLSSVVTGTSPLTYTRETLAHALCMSPRAIDRADSAGLLPRAVRVGAKKLYVRAEVEAWLQAGAPPRREWESRKAAAGRG